MIEIILVIVIMGLISIIGMNMISDSFNNSRVFNNGNANTSRTRYAIERMGREMRQIAYDSNTKAILVSSASAKSISFTKAGLTSVENFNFFTNENSSDNLSTLFLNQSSVGSNQILAEHVSTFTLTYFGAGMDVIAPISQNLGLIRFIQIDLIVHEVDTESVDLHTLISIRNG